MNILVACDAAWGIGYQGQLLQHVKADLKRFKALTTGKVVIYGTKTMLTHPHQGPLKNRTNIVLSRSLEPLDKSFYVARSVTDVLKICQELKKKQGFSEGDFFVTGGASVYEQLLPFVDTIYLTQFAETYKADAFFPNLDEMPDFAVAECGEYQEENGIKFRYLVYKRHTAA